MLFFPLLRRVLECSAETKLSSAASLTPVRGGTPCTRQLSKLVQSYVMIKRKLLFIFQGMQFCICEQFMSLLLLGIGGKVAT